MDTKIFYLIMKNTAKLEKLVETNVYFFLFRRLKMEKSDINFKILYLTFLYINTKKLNT